MKNKMINLIKKIKKNKKSKKCQNNKHYWKTINRRHIYNRKFKNGLKYNKEYHILHLKYWQLIRLLYIIWEENKCLKDANLLGEL